MKLISLFLVSIFIVSCGEPQEQNTLFVMQYQFEIKESKQARFRISLPSSIDGYQRVIENNVTPRPSRIIEEAGESYAEFIFYFPQDSTYTIEVKSQIEMLKNDSSHFNQVSSSKVQAERYLEFKDSNFQKIIPQPLLNLPPPQTKRSIQPTLSEIHRFTQTFLSKSDYIAKDQGLLKLIQSKTGDCTEYADLSVALCRNLKIPSVTHHGYVLQDQQWIPHSWTQCADQMFDPILDKDFQIPTHTGIILNSQRNPKFLLGKRFLHYDWLEGEVKMLGPPKVRVENLNLTSKK